MSKRLFFSFHYQDVIEFRANVVRQHWLTKPDREAAGFFDASIWGNAQRNGDISVKRLINSGITGTLVTCVLIGSQTYARRWVRYEIMKSLRKANIIFAVHFNGISGRDRNIKPNGPNPLNYAGVTFSDSGLTATWWEWVNGSWSEYVEINGCASFQTGGVARHYWGKAFTLRDLFPTYDWVADDGYNNFGRWIV